MMRDRKKVVDWFLIFLAVIGITIALVWLGLRLTPPVPVGQFGALW